MGGQSSDPLRLINETLDKLFSDVRDGKLDRRVGSVLTQIVNTKLRSIGLQNEVRQTEAFEADLERLEAEVRERLRGQL